MAGEGDYNGYRSHGDRHDGTVSGGGFVTATATPIATGKAVTRAQVSVLTTDGRIYHNVKYGSNPYVTKLLSYRKLEAMRRDPTIGLARDIRVAPLQIANWDIESDDDVPQEWVEFIKKYTLPLQDDYVRSAAYGKADYGWRAFEKVFRSIEDPKYGVRVIIDRLKPLDNNRTWVRQTLCGEFDGFIHQDMNSFGLLAIARSHSLFANLDEEGFGIYSDPVLLRAEAPYDEWNTANEAAKRFDDKIAGAMWVVEYPEGQSMYKGEEMDNSLIADEILKGLRASGYLKIPSRLGLSEEAELEELGQKGWKISLMESSGKQGEFISRLDYLDKLKARGVGVLERAMMEGNYGTKAEADSHLGVMFLLAQLENRGLVKIFNKEVIDDVCQLNFGRSGCIRAVPQPLTRDQREALMTVLSSLMGNQDIQADVAENTDVKEVLEILGIPVLSADERMQRDEGQASSLFTEIKQALQQSGAMNGAVVR